MMRTPHPLTDRPGGTAPRKIRAIKGVLGACALLLALAGAVFAATLGNLIQLPGTDGCVSNDGTGGDCADGRNLSVVAGVAASKDGKNVYATSNAGGVSIFLRNGFTGGLVQLSGSHGCIVNAAATDVPDCDNTGRGLNRARAIAVSPDNKNVYVTATFTDSGVAAFARDREQLGALVQLSGTDACINETGNDGCATGRALGFPTGIAVSPDGKHVYVASAGSNAIAIFARDRATGKLTQLADPDGCIVDGSAPLTGCTNTAKALIGPASVALSRDGKRVYVASAGSSAIAVFARDRATGKLTQLADPDGCIVDATATPVTGCDNTGKALKGVASIALSKDGRNVYAAADTSAAVASFSRTRSSGKLTQLADPDGCIVNDQSPDIVGCDNTGKALSGAGHSGGTDIVVSPDGRSVYVAALLSSAVAVLSRDARTGKLSQLPGTDGCVSNDGSGGLCSDGKALQSATSIAVSANGKSVYSGSQLDSAVAVFSR